MSAIDVSVQIEIAAEPTDVAAVMFDPSRDPEWMQAVTAVELIDPGIRPGARVRRTGRFVGREFSWTTEVMLFHFPHQLELRIADGPFTGTVSYQVGRSAGGSIAVIRTVGESTHLSFLPPALVAGPMKTALAADLARLKAIVEAGRA